MHWFYDPDLSKTSTSLPSDESKHAIASLRIAAGENIAVTNGRGMVCHAVVTATSKSGLEYLIERMTSENHSDVEMVLVQALAKADRDELALQAAVELGVSAVYPWESARSVVRWDANKKEKGLARWQQIAIEAMKQSHQAHLTQVSKMFDIKQPFNGQVFVLDPASKTSLDEANVTRETPIYLIVGPEGGISEHEFQEFEALGYQRVKLGDAVMRTSTAGPAAISAIRTLLRDW